MVILTVLGGIGAVVLAVGVIWRLDNKARDLQKQREEREEAERSLVERMGSPPGSAS